MTTINNSGDSASYQLLSYREDENGARYRSGLTNEVFVDHSTHMLSVAVNPDGQKFAPQVLSAFTARNGNVALEWRWEDNDRPADETYIIFRDFLRIGTSDEPWFVDDSPQEGSVYYIAAVRNGAMSLSAPVTASSDEGASALTRQVKSADSEPVATVVVDELARSNVSHFQEIVASDSYVVAPSDLVSAAIAIRSGIGGVQDAAAVALAETLDQPDPRPVGIPEFADNSPRQSFMTARALQTNLVLQELQSPYRIGTFVFERSAETPIALPHVADQLNAQQIVQRNIYDEVLSAQQATGLRFIPPTVMREILTQEVLQGMNYGLLVDYFGTGQPVASADPDDDDGCSGLGCEGLVFSELVEDYSGGAQGGWDPITGGEQIGSRADIDGDGILDNLDDDIDGDGTPNSVDEAPHDASLSGVNIADFDNDGIRDVLDPDDDNDGRPDSVDIDPNDPNRSDLDANQNGIPDDEERPTTTTTPTPPPGGGGSDDTPTFPSNPTPNDMPPVCCSNIGEPVPTEPDPEPEPPGPGVCCSTISEESSKRVAPTVSSHDPNGRPYCVSASSDPDGDGWGWENNQSCVVR